MSTRRCHMSTNHTVSINKPRNVVQWTQHLSIDPNPVHMRYHSYTLFYISFWIYLSRHGPFFHSCNTLSSLLLVCLVGLQVSILSTGVSQTTWYQIITPILDSVECGQLLQEHFRSLMLTSNSSLSPNCQYPLWRGSLCYRTPPPPRLHAGVN